MVRILVGTAGGAPANNFIMSLRATDDRDHLIGMCSSPSDLMLADVEERYVVPYADAPEFPARLDEIIARTKPDFIHSQHDFEVRALSRLRDRITSQGPRLFLPAAQTVEACVDKWQSYAIWRKKGVRVPESVLVENESQLRDAFRDFGGKVWLRANEGGGGKGALPTDNFDFARLWIERFKGWGQFSAARVLSPNSVTWMSIWYEGKLAVAQSRRRLSWNFGDRTLSGVTGVTGVGETCSIPIVDEVALAAIHAIDDKPHGIFAVDMTYDDDGHPNPTEINIGRFFTTHYFFTKAGVNFPKIYRDLGLYGKFPDLKKTINPLPDGLLWIRGMDVAPVLTTIEALRQVSSDA